MLATNLSKFNQLTFEERRLFMQAVIFLPLIHIGLILAGYPRLYRGMEKLARLKSNHKFSQGTEIPARGRAVARMVNIAAQHGFYQASCLRKSLLVWWFLRREGIRGTICFGARLVDQKLEAHAWVEYDGIVLDDSTALYKDFKRLRVCLPHTTSGL